MREGRSTRGGFGAFMAGVLVGVLVTGLVGAGGTAVVLVQHPHLASRLHTELFGSGSAAIVPLGDLTNVAVVVDVTATGHPISRYIYGVAAADKATLVALGATVFRTEILDPLDNEDVLAAENLFGENFSYTCTNAAVLASHGPTDDAIWCASPITRE